MTLEIGTITLHENQILSKGPMGKYVTVNVGVSVVFSLYLISEVREEPNITRGLIDLFRMPQRYMSNRPTPLFTRA